MEDKDQVINMIDNCMFALATSYLAEPFFKWLGVYRPRYWRFSYSVPIQALIYMFANYISRRNKFSSLN
jgi:hypothetical protein